MTQIGVRTHEQRQSVIFRILLTYSISPEAVLEEDPPAPDPSIPRIVNQVLNIKGASFFFGKETIPFVVPLAVSVIKSSADMDRFIELYHNPKRTISLILFNGMSLDAKSEAKNLKDRLRAKALVFLADYSHEIKEKLEEIGAPIEFNQCRVFLPFHFYITRPYSITNGKLARRERILKSQLVKTTTSEDGSVCGMSDLNALLSAVRQRKFRERLSELASSKTDEVSRIKKELAEYKEEVDRLDQENKGMVESIKKQKEDIDTLQYKALEDIDEEKKKSKEEKYNLEQKYQGQIRKMRATTSQPIPRELPKDLTTTKWLPCFQHLAVTPDAWDEDELKKSNLKMWETLWDMLWCLDQVMFKLKFKDAGKELEKAFNEETGYAYCHTEGKQTKQDKKFATMRSFSFDGKQYDLWKHIKYGNQEGKEIRIHFDFDEGTTRIIVGYIGPHMDNWSTQWRH